MFDGLAGVTVPFHTDPSDEPNRGLRRLAEGVLRTATDAFYLSHIMLVLDLALASAATAWCRKMTDPTANTKLVAVRCVAVHISIFIRPSILTPSGRHMTATPAPTATIDLTALGCSITCREIGASIAFYRDAVGFTVVQQYEREGKVVAAVITSGPCSIVLNQDDGKLGWERVKGQGFYLQLNVGSAAEVDRAADRITAAGFTLLSEPADRPWGARMFQFNDLDGFKLGVSTPLAG